MAPPTANGEWGYGERVVPQLRWPLAWVLALVLCALALGRWEWQMQSLGLRASDVDDGKAFWAVERRSLDRGPRDAVVLIGDSRNLFDNNLDVWQELTGLRPIQLSIAGGAPLPILQNLADDQHFAGLVVLGAAELNLFALPGNVFGDMVTSRSTALRDYTQQQSPAQRISHRLQLGLSHGLAFLDSSYALFNMLGDLPLRDRAGIRRFFFANGGTWKLAENSAGRQTRMWRRVECDRRLQQAFREVWSNLPLRPLPDQQISRLIALAAPAIDRIRARGGEVVLLRPPSAGQVRELEQRVVPRARGWDRVVRETRSLGVHFEDYDDMQGLSVPEWSHLSGSSARLFTQAYVSVLCQKSPWLQTRSLPSCYGAARTVAHVGNHY
jgi:hypothetical protein